MTSLNFNWILIHQMQSANILVKRFSFSSSRQHFSQTRFGLEFCMH